MAPSGGGRRALTKTRTMATHSTSPEIVEAAEFLKGLANPIRLLIVSHLTRGEASVGELEAALGLRQPTLSQHLAALREVGLVAGRRDAKQVFYRVADQRAPAIIRALSGIYELGGSCLHPARSPASPMRRISVQSLMRPNGDGGDR